jgi:DNA-binding GntR family transcriptional regulator
VETVNNLPVYGEPVDPELVLLPAERRPLAEEVADSIRTLILKGTLVPGQLLKEDALARSLRVSRGPVRDALAQLSREGLVARQPNRRATVAQLTREDMEEVYSLRLALERLAVTQVMKGDSDAVADDLQQVVGLMAEVVAAGRASEEACDLDMAFHDVLYAAADHRRLAECWGNLRPQIVLFILGRYATAPDAEANLVESHSEIVAAIRSGSLRIALKQIEAHLESAYERLAPSYGGLSARRGDK